MLRARRLCQLRMLFRRSSLALHISLNRKKLSPPPRAPSALPPALPALPAHAFLPVDRGGWLTERNLSQTDETPLPKLFKSSQMASK